MSFVFICTDLHIKIVICRFLLQTEEAVQSLSNAADILRITHGTNTPFVRELLVKLEEARAEASYKLSFKNIEELTVTEI